ncbi:MAG: PKD domain-containing protein [Flavobacteriales bacterium]
MKDNFEQLIKNSLENHEVTYEAGAWEKFDQAQGAATTNKSKWFLGGVALLAILTAVTFYTLNIETPTADVLPINEKVAELSNSNHSITRTSSHVDEKIEKSEKDLKEAELTLDVPTTKIEKDEINDVTNLLSTIYLDDTPKTAVSNADSAKVDTPTEPDKATKTDTKPTLQKTDTKPVKVPTPPSASFFVEKSICEGTEITLMPDEVNENFDYLWKINGEEFTKGKALTIEAETIGENTVTLFISSNGDELATKTSTFTVIESPFDNGKINLNQSSLVNELEFELGNSSNEIIWDFGDGTTSTNSTEKHTYKKAGKYTCKYTITAINGCSSTFERNINVKGYYNLRTDYGFSPRKRDNLNDVFIPVELRELNVPFEMSIYARSGQLLYTTTSINQPWDGRMQDNSPCQFGSYVWVVTLTNELGNKEVYKGTVTNVNN